MVMRTPVLEQVQPGLKDIEQMVDGIVKKRTEQLMKKCDQSISKSDQSGKKIDDIMRRLGSIDCDKITLQNPLNTENENARLHHISKFPQRPKGHVIREQDERVDRQDQTLRNIVPANPDLMYNLRESTEADNSTIQAHQTVDTTRLGNPVDPSLA